MAKKAKKKVVRREWTKGDVHEPITSSKAGGLIGNRQRRF